MGFMKQNLLPDINEITETVYNLPSVSVILPFEPKMKSKRELVLALQSALDKVERKIFDKFSVDMALLVLQKLKSIITHLDFNTHKKSVAIYVSPVFEKVLYLNLEVEEKVLVNKSFHIHDLVKSKKQLHEYLLLQLTEKECRIYVNESGEMQKIFFSSLENFLDYADPLLHRQKITNHDIEFEQINTEKFFHRIDSSLDFILESYHLPLFVMGNENILVHFNKITTHFNSVIENIQSDYKEAVIEEIKKILVPYVADWKKVKQKFLSYQLQTAAVKNKLASGLTDVYKAAIEHHCRILLIEENYEYPTIYTRSEEMIYKATQPYSRFSYLKDAVDEIIEKILDEGGDVEFVSEKIMGHYNHIALIITSKKNNLYENNYPGD